MTPSPSRPSTSSARVGSNDDGIPCFRRGVSAYPTIGDEAVVLTQDKMQLVYEARESRSIEIGHLFHDKSMPAKVDVDSLLARHFAVLGSTGVGKSSGVAIILREILQVRTDLRIFLLDCHNEYGSAFDERAHVLNSRDLKLPFWLFNFEEFVDVIYGGRSPVDEELEILSELIPLAKSNYLQYKNADRFSLKRTDPKATGFTVDTPVPYLLQDLVALLDERMGKLENRASRMNYHRLMGRIETMRNNPRYDFMFENANVGGDTMAEILNQLFRIEADGKPITIMQLAGLPVEVVDAVVCVLCRMAFDFGLWSDGAMPLLFVCEEAHRYASLDQSVGFGPTRRALSPHREGRPKIRRLPRPGVSAPFGARSEHHLAVRDPVRYANGERARSSALAVGDQRHGCRPARFSPVPVDARNHRLRRRGSIPGADEVQDTSTRFAVAQRYARRPRSRFRHSPEHGVRAGGGRTLAPCRDGPQNAPG